MKDVEKANPYYTRKFQLVANAAANIQFQMHNTLRGFSRGMFSNWLWHKPLSLLVDAGEGAQLALGANVFSPSVLAITHGHSDHVLGLAVSEMLFAAFPKAEEGELSRRLADLVRRESCADVARAIDLGASLRLGPSEIRSGGRSRIAILADVCESLIGAVFLDGGYKAAKALVERYWADRMRKPVRPLRDPKTVLQEWAQARGLPTPSYREIERTGPHHDPEFRVAVTLPERAPAEGRGRSKRAAEQAAASELLTREGVRPDG